MKINLKIGTLLSLVTIASLATLGVAYANGNPDPSQKSLCNFSWASSVDNSGGIATTGTVINSTGENLDINLNNIYPGYQTTISFGLRNDWTTPGRVSSIVWGAYDHSLFTIGMTGINLNQIINNGAEATGTITITVGDLPRSATSNHYTFSLAMTCEQWVSRGQELTVSTTSLTDGIKGASYSQTLTNKGGSSPFTWSISTGALPTGLTLNSGTGAITGTPTATGTFNFTARVTDKNGDQANSNLSIKVNNAPLSISTASLPDGKQNTNYSQSLAAAGGSGTGYAWTITSGSLPPGLSLSTAGVISGKPTTKNTYTFTIKVTDSAGATATKPLSIRVK